MFLMKLLLVGLTAAWTMHRTRLGGILASRAFGVPPRPPTTPAAVGPRPISQRLYILLLVVIGSAVAATVATKIVISSQAH